MIQVDQGRTLYEILQKWARACPDTKVHLAVPFFDEKSHLWRLLEQGMCSGSSIRLITRIPRDGTRKALLRNLSSRFKHINIIPLHNLHAKAIVLIDRKSRGMKGWIGSHNFTLSSESWALELGLAFGGTDKVATMLCRQVLAALDGWEQAYRTGRKAPKNRI